MPVTPHILVRDFHHPAGGGFATVHLQDWCSAAARTSVEVRRDLQWWTGDPDWEVTAYRYAATPDQAVAQFLARWTVPVRVTECECLTGYPSTERPAYGAVVRYHGTVAEAHGTYRVDGPCNDPHCGPGLLELAPLAPGGAELHHVDPAHVTAYTEFSDQAPVPA